MDNFQIVIKKDELIRAISLIRLSKEYGPGIDERWKSFHEIVEDYFYEISLADKVVAITKDDGSFGKGSTYELAFAKFLNKPIEIINLFERRMGFVNVINRRKRND